MNFSRTTIETAVGWVETVRRFLAYRRSREPIPAGAETSPVRRWAETRGGMHPEELNALARICGHPFAPDLPGWMETKPQFHHDCDSCRFLGRIVVNGQPADAYHCSTALPNLGGSLLARFSDEPSDYWSMDRQIVERMEQPSETARKLLALVNASEVP